MNTASRRRFSPLSISLAILVVAAIPVGFWMHSRDAHSASGHGHDQHRGHVSGSLTLNDGRRWESDAPLRAGMQRIRDAVSAAMVAHASGELAPTEAKATAMAIQENVNYLFENCKLAPEADAVLHILIADLLSGSAQLAGDPGSAEGLDRMARALRYYPEYFEHPAWVPIEASRP